MTVEGIKVSILEQKIKQSGLSRRDQVKVSLFIDIAASRDGDNTTLSQAELPDLIKDIKLAYKDKAEAAKILSALGIESGKLPEVEEEPAEKTEPKPQKQIDKSKPGAKWQKVETKGSGGNMSKSLTTWERQPDGTSIKIEPGLMTTSRGYKTVMLKSHYQSDDKTPIQIQRVDMRSLASVSVIVTENYDKQGNLQNKEFNLDNFQKNKSIGTPSIDFVLFSHMPKMKCKSSVVKNSVGREIIRYQNGSFCVYGNNISQEVAMKVLESISEDSGLTFTQEF